ncbi:MULTISPECIES: VOC family protein [unclassified Streptomyces]|uniref:VOC family protein n=1 Tax=unclassified Streptomyces TaxID=2593676 RepID=UPI002237AE95|nr:VOC family protein [Streptomyces sp. SHP 1-2]MCW5253422.1 VOC family protein [Streptomyces sp. SHP 1-2]
MTDAREPDGRDDGTGARRVPGTPCWVSLMVHAPGAAREFYGELFGWEFRPGPQQLGPYERALLDGREVAGIGRLPLDRELPVAWTPYLAAGDVDRTAEAVRLCGGTVGVGPLDAGGAGRLAVCCDPAGAVFGVWQAGERFGAAATGVPGTPVWNELVTFEAAPVAKFYESVFGFVRDPAGSPDAERVVLRLDGRAVADVRGAGEALRRDRGPYWVTSFEVDSLDTAMERVLRLGGRLLAPARDGGRGRTVLVADPEGARFALLEGPR